MDKSDLGIWVSHTHTEFAEGSTVLSCDSVLMFVYRPIVMTNEYLM
jgi:hypothetical protein